MLGNCLTKLEMPVGFVNYRCAIQVLALGMVATATNTMPKIGSTLATAAVQRGVEGTTGIIKTTGFMERKGKQCPNKTHSMQS
jgi:hypothetical protein